MPVDPIEETIPASVAGIVVRKLSADGVNMASVCPGPSRSALARAAK